MVAHGLITGMLFFVAGSVKERFHTLEIRRLGGLLMQAPHMGWILGFCAMASLGLPGLAGFWGEFPAILSAYNPAAGSSEALFRVYMVVAALGTVLAAGYLLWLLQRTAFGTPKEEFADEHIHDVHVTEWLAWVPMLRPHPRARLLPQHHLPRHRPRGAVRTERPSQTLGAAERARPRLQPGRASRRLHALAPEIVLTATLIVVLLVDLASRASNRALLGTLAGIGLLAPLVPVAHARRRRRRPVRCSAARYVVDNFALVLKALFLVAGYVVVLLSTNYIAEGDYWEGEYYFLLLSSVLGMVVMASAATSISIFVALELLSIPAYMLADVAQARPQEQRGGPEVLPDGRVRLGRHALRHVAAVRRHRYRRCWSTSQRSLGIRHHADRHAGHRVRARRLRLQGVGRAVPHLGARHLRRARRRRSPRSCRWLRRRPASSPSCR